MRSAGRVVYESDAGMVVTGDVDAENACLGLGGFSNGRFLA
jgi:hypothetical protein